MAPFSILDINQINFFVMQFDWEKEVLRRSDLLNRKIDMERLQRMTKGTGDTSAADAVAAAAKRGAKPAIPSTGKVNINVMKYVFLLLYTCQYS